MIKQANGFTLIEAMVALAILAIAAAGIIRAAQAHVDSIHGLEQRAAAQWVAQNALAEAQIGIRPGPAPLAMLNGRWIVTAEQRPSADPDLRLVTVIVRDARPGGGAAARLRGFVDAGTTTSGGAAR